MEPVRVMFVSSHAQLGGSEKVLEDLIARLEPGWIAELVSLQNGPFVERLERHGPTEVLHTGGSAPALARSALRLRARIRSLAPQVIHANGVKAAVAATLATLAGGPPVVWFKQDTTLDGRVGRAVARRCALVVGVSHAVLDALTGIAHLEVVHPGITPRTVERNQARAALGETQGSTWGERVVALVGRLHPTKGHGEVIAAAPMILAAAPTTRFVFVGGPDPSHPDYGNELRRRISEAGLDGSVVLLGHLEDPLIAIAAADVVVVPSVVEGRGTGPEGFGLVALEAMSVGTPVVAYGHGASPEVLDGAGVIVPPGDRDALGRAVVRLLSDEAHRAELIEAGRARVADFPAERVAERFQDIYRELARS